jgi:hypothetical protein
MCSSTVPFYYFAVGMSAGKSLCVLSYEKAPGMEITGASAQPTHTEELQARFEPFLHSGRLLYDETQRWNQW